NLILEKLRRVDFLVIQNRPSVAVRFVWGGNVYAAKVNFDGFVIVYRWMGPLLSSFDDIYRLRVEDMLNGFVRNDAGELVQQ
ncbi:MAG: hypothetical protein ACOVLE_12410, partial [Pirellula staleyi]